MKRTALSTAMASILAGASTGSLAAMPTEAILDFTGTFSMEVTQGVLTLTNISSGKDGGILTGVTQPRGNHATHGGPPHTTKGKLDKEWEFFSNSGQHFTTTAITVVNEDVNGDGGITKTLDFSGWRVTWNGIPEINMGGGLQDCGTTTDGVCVTTSGVDIAGTYDNGTGVATLTCGTADCPFGSTFTLTYNAVVPQADPSGFGGVNYGVNITGTILDPYGQPIANDDSAATIANNAVTIDILGNDTQNPDPAQVTVTTGPGNGAAADNGDGTITYTPANGFTGQDSFQYTVANASGTSNTATVTITVADNSAPVANDDSAEISSAVLDSVGYLSIDVLSNDTDANNSAGQPGGIDPGSVTIVQDASTGTCTPQSDGTIRYTQPGSATGVVETCTYQVSDIDATGALTSNTATVTITVTQTTSDWPTNIPANIIPVLAFEPGDDGGSPGSLPVSGSYFTMEVEVGNLLYTVIEPGPDGGLIIGREQPASGSHTGFPTGAENPGFTAPWVFFGNTGFDLTRNGGITGNPDGTLEFRNKYVVTWNYIPIINLGGSSQWPQDLGFATIKCTPAPCADGSSFVLDYAAHVEDVPGQPESGFNNVPYGLHLEGTVRFIDGTPAVSGGNLASVTRLAAGDVDPDEDVELQCAGGCFDYTIDNLTTNPVSIVLPLSGGVRDNSVWRILDNGSWRDFDTSTGDSIQSAALPAGGTSCPAPGDAAYGPVTVGHQCIQLTISDNGPNDLDPAAGTISDPGGFGVGGSAGGGTPFVDTRTSDTSGCTIAGTPVDPARRGDWWLVAGLIGLLGWFRKRLGSH